MVSNRPPKTPDPVRKAARRQQPTHTYAERFAALWQRWTGLLAAPVDGGTLAALRVVFGLVMLYQSVKFLWPHAGGSRLAGMFAAHLYHFPYCGLEWLPQLPLVGMQVVMFLLGIAALGMLVGYAYRASAVVVFVTWNLFFFRDQAYYQNHYYLISLLAGILIFCPADQRYSVAAWLRRRKGAITHDAGTIPFWPILALRAQLVFMYFFASIAKFDADWLTGIPIRGGCSDLIARLAEFGIPSPTSGAQLAFLLAWAGLFFDLAIGPLLVVRRTRPFGVGLVLAFHATNEIMFSLAALPYLAGGATVIFCEPDWPRRMAAWIRRPRIPAPNWRWLAIGAALLPPFGALLGWRSTSSVSPGNGPLRLARWTPALLVVFLTLNTLIPLRHLLIAGDPDWTEEGYRFSWRMMQRTQASSHVHFRLESPGLVTQTPAGAAAIDWRRWAGEPPAAALVAISAADPAWEQFPDLVLLYEPCLGVRALGNSRSKSAWSGDPQWQNSLALRWEAATGRRPTIRPVVTVDAALANCQSRLAAAAGPNPDERWAVQLRRIPGARQITAIEQPTTANLVELIDVLQLLADGQGGEIVREELARVQPFAVQGGQSGSGFVVLDDPELKAADVWSGSLRLAQPGQPTPVLCDPSRLRTRSWRSLPLAILCEDPQGIHVIWNHHRELTDHQINRMSKTPGMIHPYVQNVAERWQQQTGVRPRVFATALVSLNQRPTQPVVDPTVDLATAKLKLLGHSEWILPLVENRSGRGAGQVALTPAEQAPASVPPEIASATEEVLARYADGSHKTTRRVGAGGRYVVLQWYPGGRLALEAEYLNGQLDGSQTKYRPDGSRDIQMHYREGRPHGEASAWHPNGQLASRRAYQHGKPLGESTTWDADGKLISATPQAAVRR